MRRKLIMLFNIYKNDIKKSAKILIRFLFLTVSSIIIGIVTGFVGTAFKLSIRFVTGVRSENSLLILCLPLVGVITCLLYRVCRQERSTGTNLVLESVRTEEKISVFTAPLMFVCTVISHLCGASVGCEGAALQIGGGIGQCAASALKMGQKDIHVMTMCGMSGCFAALFGTPIAAAVFAIEVISVGVMYYSSLVPCVVSSLTAHYIAHSFGVDAEIIKAPICDNYDVLQLLKVALIAIGCAVVSILFCRALRLFSHIASVMKNPIVRSLVMSAVACGFIFLFGADDYAGAGTAVINRALGGSAHPFAFLIKILLTAICVNAGLKGGEIIPSFFIGATFGAVVGPLIGINAGFAAAIGLLGVFCGVTNCPVATLVIAVELFGSSNAVYYMIAIAISYFCSGYYGLYSTQKIVYSKYLPEFINIKAK